MLPQPRGSPDSGEEGPHTPRRHPPPYLGGRDRLATRWQPLHGKNRADRNALTIDQRGVCCGIEPDGMSVPAERHVTAEVISYGTLPPLAAWILVELSGIERPAEMSSELSRLCVRVVARHLRGMRIRILVS